jgi:predicted nucleic-acid-binding protein
MIAVDTNLLLRLVVSDDNEQHEMAKTFFAARSASDPAFVATIVMAEFAWVLTKRFGFPKDSVADLILALLRSPDLVIERPDLVAEAALQSRKPKVGFSDAFIAQLALAQGCRSVMTFDKDAAKRIPGMDLLA